MLRTVTPTVAVPRSRPGMARAVAETWLAVQTVPITLPAILGIRGYYRDTLGVPGVNDTGIYDDCIAIIAPRFYRTFNANTDPSKGHPHVATLQPGVWKYRRGIHGLSKPKEKQYYALVQAAPVTVSREGAAPTDPRTMETGLFGINIHKGSYTSTSSEGCQTIYPEQWDEFTALCFGAMKDADSNTLQYVLVNA